MSYYPSRTRITISLTTDTVEKLNRPVVGNGGFQGLLRTVQAGINTQTNTLNLAPQTAARILKLSKNFKNNAGGFQGRLRGVADAIRSVKRELGRRG